MILTKAAFALTLTLGTLAAPLGADAQQPAKVRRIGFLLADSPARWPYTEVFRQGLGELGWVEGQNITIEYRWAEGNLERLPDLAAELVRLKVDIIVALAAPVVQAAKNATRTIPIVMFAGDAVGAGFVASLARPGGNITGLSIFAPELSGKRLELLKEAIPRLSRVAVLWNPANPVSPHVVKATEVVARSLGVELQILEARGPEDFATAFSTMARGRAEALFLIEDPMLIAHLARILELAAKNRLPAMYPFSTLVEAGGLMSYGPHIGDTVRRAVTYVDKILRGAKPADLPVEQPTRFELVINQKTAKALGLTIPPSVLIRADKIIE
ncbi:MAG: ABC transporter substrate-binding protein [Candidatus Rokubacteria bacterium]|nr:ABC transporter substrate-binding protein [Candidatus Rokubacteria bacterium]